MGAGALLAILLALLAAAPVFVTTARQALFDGYQQIFPRERKSRPVVVVSIDEHSLEAHGQWPWPRTLMAALVERISRMGALAIGFDILFPEPDRYSPGALAGSLPGLPGDLVQRMQSLPSNDERFAQAIHGRNVVLAMAGEEGGDGTGSDRSFTQVPVRFHGDAMPTLRRYSRHIGNVPELDRAAAGHGLISVDASDTQVRRVNVLAEVEHQSGRAFALEVLRVAVGATALEVRERAGGLLEIGLGDARIPVQENGSFWLYFSRRADPALCERCVAAADVLSGRLATDTMRDKVVLVGVTGLGLLDYKVNPFGEKVPGVEGHAQFIEQVFDGSYLVRPRWAFWLELLLLLSGGLILVAIVPRRRVSTSVASLGAVLVFFAAAGIAAFAVGGILVDVLAPGVGTLAVFGFLLTGTLAETQRQRHALREAAARVAGELDAARRIQMGLLPRPREVFRGEHGFDLEALLEPARSVGGDFYDCLKLDDDRLFFAVGDVSGKGMPAALFMALSMSVVRAAATRSRGSLGAVVSRAAAEIESQNPEFLFVTLFAAILDLRSGMLEFCNAGHPPAYARLPSGKIERYPDADGPPLCVLSGFEYTSRFRQLVAGEWLCVVTDGVTEATDDRNALYGTQRFVDAMTQLRYGAPAQELAMALRNDVGQFSGTAPLSDDLTLLTVCWTGARG